MPKYALVDNTQVVKFLIPDHVLGSAFVIPSNLNLFLVDDATVIGDGWDNELQVLTPLDPSLELTEQQQNNARLVALEAANEGRKFLQAPQPHIIDPDLTAPTDLSGLDAEQLTTELNEANERYNDLATKVATLFSYQENQKLLEGE